MECFSCAIRNSDVCLVLGLCVEKIWAYNSVKNNIVFIIGLCRTNKGGLHCAKSCP